MSPTIRPVGATDADAVRRVVGEAFGAGDPDAPHARTVVDLVDALGASGRLRAHLVAEADGGTGPEVVGQVTLSHGWLDVRERLVDVLVLSPLSVRPGHQGAGTGTALLAAAVEAAAGLGAPALFLEGSPGFYGARGFGRASAHGFDRPSVRIPDRAFQVHLLPAHEAWMRGRLVYAEPFWTHDCVGLRDPDLAEVEQALAEGPPGGPTVAGRL